MKTKEEIKLTIKSDKYGVIGNCINGTTCTGCIYNNNPDDKACVGCSKRIENYEIYISKPE